MIYMGDEYGEYGGADPDNRHMWRNATERNDREQHLHENISAIGQVRAESKPCGAADTLRFTAPGRARL